MILILTVFFAIPLAVVAVTARVAQWRDSRRIARRLRDVGQITRRLQS